MFPLLILINRIFFTYSKERVFHESKIAPSRCDFSAFSFPKNVALLKGYFHNVLRLCTCLVGIRDSLSSNV